MQGLNEKSMEAVVRTLDLNEFYYPTLFPLTKRTTLTWSTLEAESGLHIAGDLVARGASLDRKTREALAELRGDMPKIAISRDMDENELDRYDEAVALAQGSADAMELVEVWANDVKFCFTGVASRLEWMALQIISRGKLKLTNANNKSVITEYDMDYAIPSDQKKGYYTGSASWAAGTTAKPITKDMLGVVKAAKAKGISLKYAFMNPTTFGYFAQQEEVIKHCASFAQNQMGINYEPDLGTVNTVLAKKVGLNGLKIILIDQQVTLEIDGVRTTVNPFEDNVVMYSESATLGKTYWKTPKDMTLKGSAAIKVMQGHTCIKKWSEEEPIKEITQGIANAVPVWASSGRSFLQKVDNSSWNL